MTVMSVSRRHVTLALLATLWVAVISAPTYAQSALGGAVTDETGGVLPGVTVQATSPALIEGVRTVVTDGRGRYNIIDLRPGTYDVRFTLAGFATVVREGLVLASNVTLSVNAVLDVGGIEVQITVSGESSIVDVQQTQRTQTLPRDLLDAIPTGRNVQSIAAVVPGIKISSPDVGGAQGMQQTSLSVRGAGSRHTTFQVDGMMVNGIQGGGAIQNYFNDAMNEEVSYQTSGVSAEVSGGGVRVNMIPRTGGNTMSGALFVGGSNGAWQADNFTQELKDRGLRAVGSVDRVYDVNFSQGGPIVRDKLWFFGTFRQWGSDIPVADVFFADGSQGVDDGRIRSGLMRLTWQATSRNKITAYMDRIFKWRWHQMSARDDPLTASGVRWPIIYYMGQVKWTSTPSNRMLIELGYSTNIENYSVEYQPGIRQERGTPAWFAGASRQDTILGTRWAADANENFHYPERFVIVGSSSYVTGSHVLKSGIQWTYGTYERMDNRNADLIQRYRNGVPSSVVTYNTPVIWRPRLNYDLGIYTQDQWTIDRVTVNAGIRFEWLNASNDAVEAGPGRFVPARRFPEMKNVPDWFDITPRLGVAYDVFGNARTAIKGVVAKYLTPETTDFAARYNPAFSSSDTRTWTDLNGDDIAQDNELGPTTNVNFGIRSPRRPDPDIAREYNIESSISLIHELFSGFSVTTSFYHRRFKNLGKQDNILIEESDYSPVTTTNPLTGAAMTVYSLDPAKRGLIDIVDSTSATDQLTVRSLELLFNARLPNGGTVFGGWTTEQIVGINCDTDNPNDRIQCDHTQFDIPWRPEIKLAGNYPLPYGLQVSAVLQSYAGGATSGFSGSFPQPWLNVNYRVPSSVARDEGGTVVVPLIEPGTKFLKRWNQLDVGVKKIFDMGGTELHAQFDLFNALNSAVVLAETQTWGSALGRPSSVIQGRLPRIAMQLKW